MFDALPSPHPFLVHFPIALFSMALVLDLALLARFRLAWIDRSALAGYGAAALSSLAAAVSGKISADDLAPSLGAQAAASVLSHGDWAFLTVVLFFIVLFVRVEASWRDRASAAPRPSRARLAASVLAIAAQWSLFVTAERGGELVYRYGVGVVPGGLEERR